MAGGGVLQLAAAYNAGPGNVMRWMNGKDDPLMFIETMSAQETRAYVKRVMTYYWIYSEMAGKSSKTLDDTARGYWPRYDATYTAPRRPLHPPSIPATVRTQQVPGTAAQPPAAATAGAGSADSCRQRCLNPALTKRGRSFPSALRY